MLWGGSQVPDQTLGLADLGRRGSVAAERLKDWRSQEGHGLKRSLLFILSELRMSM